MKLEKTLKRLAKMKLELEELGCRVEIKVVIERPSVDQNDLEYLKLSLSATERELRAANELWDELEIDPYKLSVTEVLEIKGRLQ